MPSVVVLTNWTWDTAAYGLGKFHTLASRNAVKTSSYNARGQLEGLTLSIRIRIRSASGESAALKGKLSYDAFGRVKTIT